LYEGLKMGYFGLIRPVFVALFSVLNYYAGTDTF